MLSRIQLSIQEELDVFYGNLPIYFYLFTIIFSTFTHLSMIVKLSNSVQDRAVEL